MKAHLYIILLFSACMTTLSAQNEISTEGDRNFALQDYFAALQAYATCYEKDTTNKTLLLSMAHCEYLLGDYQKAKEYYHQLENDSLYTKDAKIKLAAIYESQQNLPKAIKYNIALSKLFPGNPAYLRKLGLLYQQGNEPTQSLQYYQSAIKLNARDLLAVQGLAEMMLSLEQTMAVDSMLTKALTIDSTHIGLSLLSGRTKYKLKDYVACAHILHKLTYQTELSNYHNKMLGYAFMQIDSLDKAIFHLQKSLLNENDPEYALFYLALAYEKKKEFEKSKYFYSEAIKAGISDNLDQYHRGLGRISSAAGNFREAVEHYQNSLKYHNDGTVYFYMAAASEQYQKDKTKAIEYYKKYLNSKYTDKEKIEIAKSRILILKEQKFMKTKS